MARAPVGVGWRWRPDLSEREADVAHGSQAGLPHLDKAGRPTLATVAALAGVHTSTASRALSSSLASGVRIGSVATVERIRKVADDVGFARNLYAAGLRTQRTALAGVGGRAARGGARWTPRAGTPGRVEGRRRR